MRDVLVLGYHAVSERWPAPLSTTPQRLEDQLRFLLRKGYQGAVFHEAVTAPSAARTLAVTFDDAYRSVIDLAFPILSKLGIPATVFAPTHFVGQAEPMAWPGIDRWLDGPHEGELRCMTWDQLRALRDSGWEIGSHTLTHPKLTQLDDDALSLELDESRRICTEQLGVSCRSLAYPYGDTDSRVVAATAKSGYTAAAALPGRLHPASALRWPRIGIYHPDDQARFRAKTSLAGRRLRASPAWGLVARLRGQSTPPRATA